MVTFSIGGMLWLRINQLDAIAANKPCKRVSLAGWSYRAATDLVCFILYYKPAAVCRQP
jgi:hypothetical protein